jgi:DNA mismatch repair protein MutS
VAKLAGLPAPVLSRAKDVLMSLERGSSKLQKNQKEALQRNSQLSMFEEFSQNVPEHLAKLETSLRALDLNHVTPFDALHTLKSLKDTLPSPATPC